MQSQSVVYGALWPQSTTITVLQPISCLESRMPMALLQCVQETRVILVMILLPARRDMMMVETNLASGFTGKMYDATDYAASSLLLPTPPFPIQRAKREPTDGGIANGLPKCMSTITALSLIIFFHRPRHARLYSRPDRLLRLT